MAEAPNTPTFRIEPLPFDRGAIAVWGESSPKHQNWPVVYTINGSKDIYVGETSSALKRMRQHLDNPDRASLTHVRILFDDTFNKSACHDLESHLICYFAADGKFNVLNQNRGVIDSDYFDRKKYRERFDEIFEALVNEKLLTRSIPDIINSEMFKYSPFKALNIDQASAIEGIIESLSSDVPDPVQNPIVVQGDPGTGKSIVAIYLVKLLSDIANADLSDDLDRDSIFGDYFTPEFQAKFANWKIGLVIPQQALRQTVSKVFAKTPGLNKKMVVNQFDVGAGAIDYDLLIVDESHRLGQRSNQPSANLNKKFTDINISLFGDDDLEKTQLDWIFARSKHQILLLDSNQTIKPGDLPLAKTTLIETTATNNEKLFRLASQMRVEGGNDYIEHVSRIFAGTAVGKKTFGNYRFELFDDIREMRDEITRLNNQSALARLIAGYAWKWVSKKSPATPDIHIDGTSFFWNRKLVDWVNSPTSPEEVGSIHTIQGYDLNYAGVIIGNDLRFNPATQQIKFSRADYFDKKGREDNRQRKIHYSDEDILEYVKNIYKVLLTRGIKGTFVYACDPDLREYLRKFIN
jgi:uncharacterized protein